MPQLSRPFATVLSPGLNYQFLKGDEFQLISLFCRLCGEM